MTQTELRNTLAYINRFYDWTDEEKRDIWVQSFGNNEMCMYWKRLATAFRYGYRQTAENNFMRLVEFEKKYVDPFLRGEISVNVIKELQDKAEAIDECR